MTTVEQYNLQRCETIIEANLKGFVEVGLALLEIKEGQFYKGAGFKSFNAYCIERWNMGANYANRTIKAATYSQSVPMGTTLPNERQARKAIEASRNQSPEEPTDREVFVSAPIDRNRIRCDEIMRELRDNGELAKLVRIELMQWYAVNTTS